MLGVAEREDALLGARLFLVAARAAEGGVEAVLSSACRSACVFITSVWTSEPCVERLDAARQAVLVDMHDQVEPELRGAVIAERDHLAEFPGRVDVQQRERRLRRIERLERQMQHDGRILADRIEHHRVVGLGDHLADDVNALRFELLEVRQPAPAAAKRPARSMFGGRLGRERPCLCVRFQACGESAR